MANRREFLFGGAALVGGAAAIASGCGSATPGREAGAGAPSLIETESISDTSAGKVRGYKRNGIHAFRGIPYAAPTSGKARFLPAAKPEPWTGVRTALSYGSVCPTTPRAGWKNDEEAFLFQWDDGQFGEDCLNLNVWTPGLDAAKRPVMVWIHGGGFQSGSSHELPGYYGENLSKRGNVVVVGVNHRLGPFGFLNLADYGSQYADSANLGMLDLIVALQWVRDNIAAFGGDAGNVTIFGQSGGGGKVTTLMAMPGAKGLFHKAAVQSGSMLTANTPEASARMAAAVVAALGISKAQIAKIHDVPFARLVNAGAEASAKLSPPTPAGSLPSLMWGPTADGKTLPGTPFTPTAPEVSADVPLLVGTVLNEFIATMSSSKAEAMTDDDLFKPIAARYGTKAPTIIAEVRRIYPQAKPVELASIVSADMFRSGAVKQAERKAAQGKAPAYAYQFRWKTPILGGAPRAFHCSEIPFVFYNTELVTFATGPDARTLSEKMSDAWLHFARTGDPNHPGLPAWPKYEAEKGKMMVFDKVCEAIEDPERELRRLLA